MADRLRDALLLVVDTETTGVDVTTDRVVELGAVYFQGGARGEVRRMRINPGRPIPEEASKIHGIYDDHVRDKPRFAEVAPRFLMHIEGRALPSGARGGQARPRIVGYNAAGFDVPLLNAELLRAGIAHEIDASQVLDLMVFARWHHRELRSRSLESVCAHHRIPMQRAHSALSDALATGHLLLRMIDAGMVPDEVQAAMSTQARIQGQLVEERRRWSYWLYRDRQGPGDRRLRMGAGRHCGRLLDDIDSDYLGYLLDKIADLPDEVRAIFLSRRRAQHASAELDHGLSAGLA